MHPILPRGSVVAVDRAVTDPRPLQGKIVAACADGRPIIRWLEISGRHLILRPNQQTGDNPMIAIELAERDRQPDRRPGRLVLEPLQRRLSGTIRPGRPLMPDRRALSRAAGSAALRSARALRPAGRIPAPCPCPGLGRRPSGFCLPFGRPAVILGRVAPVGPSHLVPAAAPRPAASIDLMASPRVSGVRRLDAWLQHAREPVFVLNAERRLVYVNRAWEELTGYAAEAVLGLDCRAHGPARAGDPAGLGEQLLPAPGGPGRPARRGADPDRPRPGRAPLAAGRVLALSTTPGGLLCLLRAGPRARGPAPRPRRRRRSASAPSCWRSATAARPARVRYPDRPGARPSPAARPGRRGRRDHRPGPDRRRAGHGQAAGGPDDPPAGAASPGAAPALRLRGPAAGGPRARAVRRREGRRPPALALPEGSTLLLRDVLDLPRDLQGRLASALRPGVRLLATTAGDPERAWLDDRLRPDLYYALTTLVIRLAPLRDRLDELPLLAQHLLERANLRGQRRRSGFSPEALDALIGYDWPGNLRELARVIDAAHARRGRRRRSSSTTCRPRSAATWARPTPRRRCPRRSRPWTSC